MERIGIVLLCVAVSTSSYSFHQEESCLIRDDGFIICKNSGVLTSVRETYDQLPKKNQFSMIDHEIYSIAPHAFENLHITEVELVLTKGSLKLMPDCFSGLSNVKTLKIYSKITQFDIHIFEPMKSLTFLALSIDWSRRTQEGSAPTELRSLEHLKIFDSLIRNANPSTFVNISETIHQLSLSSNGITVIEPKTFSVFKELKFLDLHSNLLSSIPKDSFEGLHHLEVLDLSWNGINHIEPNVFVGTNISELNLFTNLLRTLQSGVFTGLSTLKSLRLENNRINKIEAGVFPKLTVSILDLSNNDLSVLEPGTFYGLTADIVYLSDNNLVNIKDGAFYGSKVKELDLSYNNLKYYHQVRAVWGLLNSTNIIAHGSP